MIAIELYRRLSELSLQQYGTLNTLEKYRKQNEPQIIELLESRSDELETEIGQIVNTLNLLEV